MFVLLRLFLAHLIADFPLQFDWIIGLKNKVWWGSFFHAFIFFLCSALLLWPCWGMIHFWIVLISLFLIHSFQDWLKILFWRRFGKDNLGVFLAEQMIHVFFLSMVIFTSLRHVQPPRANGFLISLYTSDLSIIYAIAFVLSSSFGAVVVYYVKKGVVNPDYSFIPLKEKLYGSAERVLITILIIVPGYWFILTPLIPLARWFQATQRGEEEGVEIITSCALAATVGIIMRIMSLLSI